MQIYSDMLQHSVNMEKFIGTLIVLRLVSMAQAFTSVCDPNPCSPGGRCAVSSPTKYTCSCYFGYVPAQQNTQCVDRNECSISAHLCHNGTCINTQGSFHCKCNDGYIGKRCMEKANPCDSSPCLNGGKCTQTTTGLGYSCSCYNGFLQPDCHDRDECSMAHNICHNGKCVNTPGSFRCDCNDGYSGSHCTIQNNPCASSPCTNAKCTPSSSSPGYSCSCYAGFIPPDCSDRDECMMVANLCHNGTCVNTPGSFQCKCHNGFSGSHCTSRTNPCASSPCLNGGKCSTSASGYTCSCKPGHSLPNCIDKDECAFVSNLCHNGSCFNTLGSYKCVCNKGYAGPHCTVQSPSTVTSTTVTATTTLSTGTTSTYASKNTVKSSTSSRKVSSPLQPNVQYRASLSKDIGSPDKTAWSSSHWWVFVLTGTVVCVGAVTTTVVVIKRRKSVYKTFHNAPSTPTSPTPITQENPLYMAIHGLNNNNNTDITTSSKPPADQDELYIDMHRNDHGDSEI